jgi:UDP-2,3-diacylglucosamine hydrolase
LKAIFLADVHLQGGAGEREKKLLRFLDHLEAGSGRDALREKDPVFPDRLILAGDIFDFWFSRDGRIYPGFAQVVERLSALKRAGVRIGLCEGNHDFFLAEYFSSRLGMEVYPDGTDLDCDGLRLFVTHGDAIDRTNHSYLVLRRFLRSRFAFFLQQLLPLPLLWSVARLSSALSKGMSTETRDRLASVMVQYAMEKFGEGYDGVILGHCHLPVLKEVFCGGKRRIVATLGDWITYDTYLHVEAGRFVMERFAPGD